MRNNRVRISWLGVILIVVGVLMLLSQLSIVDVQFSTIFWPLMMLVGIVTVGRGYSQNRRAKTFWGTVLFLYSLFFFLRTSDYFELHARMFFPATFLIFGIAFFMMYLNNFKDWPLLIPAFMLGGVGSMFLLSEYGYLYNWEVWDMVRLYWPIILILFGIAIILRRRYSSNRTSTNTENVAPPPVA